MKAILVNYNFTPDWLKDTDLDYVLYDRSDSPDYLKDFPQDRIIYTENVGNIDYDKLSYIVDNYETLPDVFLWGKTNLFKYITEEEFKDIKDNMSFTPLLTKGHKEIKFDGTLSYINRHGTPEDICFYKDGIYHELNNNWYINPSTCNYFKTFNDFCAEFGIHPPKYISFAPGGNYILTKETVYKYPKELYNRMRSVLPYTQLPTEAQFAERSYYLLWK